jgi:hypothetical protein
VQVVADPVEHLQLVPVGADPSLLRARPGPVEHPLVVSGEGRIDAARQRLGRQQPVRQPGVARVDVALVGERELRRLAIGALAQADGRADLDQPLDVLRRAAKVGLDDAGQVGMRRVKSPVELERPVRVGRGFHVDPHERPGGEASRCHPLEVRAAHRLAEIQSEVRELERRNRSKAPARDLVEHPEVRVGRVGGIVGGRDVFAEVSHRGVDAVGVQARDDPQGILEHRPGDEAPDEPPRRRQAVHRLTDPAMRRQLKKDRPAEIRRAPRSRPR